MRKTMAAVAVFLVGILGMFVAPSPAAAVLPAPACESGNLEFFCDAASTGTTEWTITFYYPGNTVVMGFTTTGPRLWGGCDYQVKADAVYRFNGQDSAVGKFLCRSGPWQ